MRFSENLLIARIVLAAVIVFSLVFGGGGALMDRRIAAEAQFNADSESISAELNEMRSNAVVLSSIAAKYKTADQTFISDLNAAVALLDEAKDVSSKHAASLKLDSAVENVYSNLTGLQLGEMDAQDARYAYKNFTSAQLRIEHDGYNALAEEFNRDLDRFPANLLGALRGVKPLGLFR